MRIQCCSDVESVFLLHDSFNDIGARQAFEMSDFFMPELLIKELCLEGGPQQYSWFSGVRRDVIIEGQAIISRKSRSKNNMTDSLA